MGRALSPTFHWVPHPGFYECCLDAVGNRQKELFGGNHDPPLLKQVLAPFGTGDSPRTLEARKGLRNPALRLQPRPLAERAGDQLIWNVVTTRGQGPLSSHGSPCSGSKLYSTSVLGCPQQTRLLGACDRWSKPIFKTQGWTIGMCPFVPLLQMFHDCNHEIGRRTPISTHPSSRLLKHGQPCFCSCPVPGCSLNVPWPRFAWRKPWRLPSC